MRQDMPTPLHVGIDARTLNVRHMRGTGRYIYEILRHVRPEDGVRFTAFGHDPSLPVLVPPELQGVVEVFPFRGHRFQAWEQVGLPWRLRRSPLQVMHCADNTAPIWQPRPTVVTIHDTVPWAETAPDALTHHYLHHVQGVALRRCAAVITISESSRRDIVSRWPSLAGRLRVIPHGIADEFFAPRTDPLPQVLSDALGGAAFVLYVGGPQPRKRFAWAQELVARSGRPDLHLVAVGFASGTAQRDQIPAELAGRVHFAPFVSEGELVALYRAAQAAIYPTLYEGFGFPAVEAQAAGTPVLLSPVSSLADLVGPLAWALPPQDQPAWQAALAEILALTPAARAERAARALAWTRQFSWRKSVEAHLEVYRGLAGAGGGAQSSR
jgi:glycosyltransferase involved in cell wall biosynthesis